MIGSGVFLLPAALAVVALERLRFTARMGRDRGRMLLAGVSEPRARVPEDRRPVRLRASGVRRLHGVPDRVGYWIAAWVGNAAIATAFVGALAVFIPRLGADTTNGHVWAYVTAIGTIWLLTLINAWG